MGKRIVFAVTNDLSFDQRMHKISSTLVEDGNEVLLVGRELPHSLSLKQEGYEQVRLRCKFQRGKLFYLEYNFRLWLYLRSVKADVYGIVDLDTALPLYFTARRDDKPWTFDAHEYYSELEEVIRRPFVHAVWKRIERFIVTRAKHAYTISEGYAKRFKMEYGTPFKVVRNVPVLRAQPDLKNATLKNRKPIILYQGALNIGRGLEASIEAMQSLDAELHIYGDGPQKTKLEALIAQLKLSEKVKMCGAKSPDVLRTITPSANIGLTLFSEVGFHHQHSLANRFFDYMHAGLPQICMNYPEYRKFNEEQPIAVLIDELTPKSIEESAERLFKDEVLYHQLKANCQKAAQEHHWGHESKTLLEIYRAL